MNRRDYLVRLALVALPVLTAATALSFFFATDRTEMKSVIAYTFVLAALALLLSVEAMWLYYQYSRHRPRLKRVGGERDFLKRRAKFLESRLASLEDDVEVLSAVRQLARVAGAHDELDRVLEETLRIVQDLVNADWVTIFVHDEKTGKILPRAHRKGADTSIGARIPPEVVDDSHVREVFQYESAVMEIEGDNFYAAVPAISGGDKVGVLAVSAPLGGTPEDKASRIDAIESALKEVAENIAYALRAATLQTRAFEDDLTGLGNRGLFEERLGEMVALASRKNQPLSLVLVDIDRFKSVNDTYGHQTGDRVLRDVASLLSKNLRRYDSAYRYGGEELALLLPQTDLKDAARLAERIRDKLEKKVFLSGKLRVTASFGVASLGGKVLTQDALVAAADAELYRAKSGGRNRVEPAAMLASK